MRTRLKEENYTRPMGVSMDYKSILKINHLQDLTLLDRSQLLRIILHQLTPAGFEKMYAQERKEENKRLLLKRKVELKKKSSQKLRKKKK